MYAARNGTQSVPDYIAIPAEMNRPQQGVSQLVEQYKKLSDFENLGGSTVNNNAEILDLLTEIRDLLTAQTADLSPNYRYELGDYAGFDWASIGASIANHDGHGTTAVRWNHHVWTRRSGEGKFGKAIWFSRPNGKDESGDNKYLRLITFKDTEPAEPLPRSLAPATRKDDLVVGQIVKVQGKKSVCDATIQYIAPNGMISVLIKGQSYTISKDKIVG